MQLYSPLSLFAHCTKKKKAEGAPGEKAEGTPGNEANFPSLIERGLS